MKLTSFEINNFRSIKQLKCHVLSQITILAGKNESGKTSILLALEKFKKEFEDSDIPISANREDVSVMGTFELTDLEIESISEEFSFSINPSFKEITVKATFGDSEIFGKAHDKIKETILEETEDSRGTVEIQINVIRQSGQAVDVLWKDVDDLDIAAITHNLSQFSSIINQLQSNPTMYGENITAEYLSYGETALQSILQRAEIFQSILAKIKNYIPNIIYFDSFEGKLPSEIELQEAIRERDDANVTTVAKDFIKLSGLDLEKLNEPDKQHRDQAAIDATEVPSGMFEKYWKQDQIGIKIGCDGSGLTFFVRERGKKTLFKPEQRSRGIQWFMCFLTRLFINNIESKNNLILIDEPGLYLHSKAQQDVLKMLEDISSDSQIIFSTHSPYLIDPSKLNRIRLVIKKDEEGTIIHNDFYTDADVDTMSPIIMAIGLDMSKGIGFLKKKNIIVEGISDYYYLSGMKMFLENHKNKKFPEDLVFVPCVGESKVSLLASIFIGYGADFKIMLDSKGSQKTRNKLKRDELEDKIIIVGKDEESIENMFDKNDFNNICVSNKGDSKTILSIHFLEEIQNNQTTQLSDITIRNFEQLFEKIIKPENYTTTHNYFL